jgi:hypothetical protein
VAFTKGASAWIMLDGVNGAGTNVSAYADNFSLPNPTDTPETTTFSNNAKTFIAGLGGGGVAALSGPLDTAFAVIVANVDAAQKAGSTTSTVIFSAAGSASGSLKQTAEVWISDFTTSVGVGGRAEFSASMQITGALVTATW